MPDEFLLLVWREVLILRVFTFKNKVSFKDRDCSHCLQPNENATLSQVASAGVVS